jgi:predicted Zn-dependent peptidase
MVLEALFNGFNSKVFGRLRELGLAYGIYSSLYETKNNSIFTISGQVQASNIIKLSKILRQELNKIADTGVSPTLLNELKKRSIGSLVRSNQTAGAISNWYNGPFTMFGRHEPFSDLPNRISSVTNQTVIEAANTLINSKINGVGFMHNPSDKLNADKIQQILIGQ